MAKNSIIYLYSYIFTPLKFLNSKNSNLLHNITYRFGVCNTYRLLYAAIQFLSEANVFAHSIFFSWTVGVYFGMATIANIYKYSNDNSQCQTKMIQNESSWKITRNATRNIKLEYRGVEINGLMMVDAEINAYNLHCLRKKSSIGVSCACLLSNEWR